MIWGPPRTWKAQHESIEDDIPRFSRSSMASPLFFSFILCSNLIGRRRFSTFSQVWTQLSLELSCRRRHGFTGWYGMEIIGPLLHQSIGSLEQWFGFGAACRPAGRLRLPRTCPLHQVFGQVPLTHFKEAFQGGSWTANMRIPAPKQCDGQLSLIPCSL